ncbi:MAG: hypothetical protein ACLR17_02255 [Enterobacteriaceae bacterium]
MRVAPIQTAKSSPIALLSMRSLRTTRGADGTERRRAENAHALCPAAVYLWAGRHALKNAGSVEPVRATLRWSLSQQNNRQTLCIENRGNQHARLSAVYWANANGKGRIPRLMVFSATFWRRKRAVSRAPETLPCRRMHLFAKLTDNGQAVEIPANR